jgi:hypothetical protein
MSALTAPLLGSECQSSGAGFIAQRGNEFIALVHRSGQQTNIGQNCPEVNGSHCGAEKRPLRRIAGVGPSKILN